MLIFHIHTYLFQYNDAIWASRCLISQKVYVQFAMFQLACATFGLVRTVRQIPRANALGIWLPVSHAPSCIGQKPPPSPGCWGPNKMAAISQMTFSKAFSWMKMFKFRLKFHLSSFLRVQMTIFQHWFRWWQWRLNYRHLYASIGLTKLIIVYIYTYICLLFRENGSGPDDARHKVNG